MFMLLSLLSSFACFFFLSAAIFKGLKRGEVSLPSSETKRNTEGLNSTSDIATANAKEGIVLIKTFIPFAVAIASMLLLQKLVLSFSLLLAGFIAPKMLEKVKTKRRLKLFNGQLADGITLIANSLNSGFSLQQSIDTMVKQLPPPISYEFLLALREYRLGKTLELALADMQRRVPSEELHLIVTAISLSKETGGNLSQVLESIANMVREKIRLEGKVEALTSNGKLQGLIIGLLPLGIGVIMHFIDPELIEPMYKTQVGWALIGIMAMLETVGAVVIRRIVTIEF